MRAEVENGGSGLGKEVSVDLNKTPILNITWKIEKDLSGIDEKSKKEYGPFVSKNEAELLAKSLIQNEGRLFRVQPRSHSYDKVSKGDFGRHLGLLPVVFAVVEEDFFAWFDVA